MEAARPRVRSARGALGAAGAPGLNADDGQGTYAGAGGDTYLGLPGSPYYQWTGEGGGGGFPSGRNGAYSDPTNACLATLAQGNAPPTCNPLAGQGINLGFADADVFCEELIKAYEKKMLLDKRLILKKYEIRRKNMNYFEVSKGLTWI